MEKPEEYNNEGDVFQSLGNYESAVVAYDRAITLDPNNIWAFNQKIGCLRQLGKNAEADSVEEEIKKFNLSEPDNNRFPLHDPYLHLLKILLNEDNENPDKISQYLNTNILAFIKVIYGFKNSDIKNFKHYSESDTQWAYVLSYYPYYIETIYHELAKINTLFLQDSYSHHMGVCIYGCGPAPEYMGLLQYVKDYLPQCTHLKVYLFDKNDWINVQTKCIESLESVYLDPRIKVSTPKMKVVDFLSFEDAKNFEKYPEIRSSKLHIFQNSIRDLLDSAQNRTTFFHIMDNFFKELYPGSIIVFIDMDYRNSRNCLSEIESILKNSNKAIVCKNANSKPHRYASKIKKNPNIEEFLTKELQRSRIWTHYYSLILQKTNFTPDVS